MIFLLEQESFWTLVMWERYGSWTTGEEVRATWSASFLWCKVYSHAQEVTAYTKWIIGDRLRDVWLYDIPLCKWPTMIYVDI